MDGWMPESSGWTKYYVIFLSAISSLLIPLVLELFGKSLRRNSPKKINDSGTPNEEGESSFNSSVHVSQSVIPKAEGALGRRMNTRFFLSANAAILLLTLMLILIPLSGVLASSGGKKVLVAVLSMTSFAGLGLLYSAKKGDLDWIQTFHDEGRNQNDRK